MRIKHLTLNALSVASAISIAGKLTVSNIKCALPVKWGMGVSIWDRLHKPTPLHICYNKRFASKSVLEPSETGGVAEILKN